MHVVVIQAGTSTTRQLTRDIVAALPQDGLVVDTLDVRQLAHQVVDVHLTGIPSEDVEQALDTLEAADAVIAATPVFAGSYSGLFKSFIDLVGTQRLENTPVLLAATGGSTRHSLMVEHALRPLLATLRAHVIPTAIFAAPEDFANPGLSERIARASSQLVQAYHPAQKASKDTTLNAAQPAPLPSANNTRSAGKLLPQFEDFVPMEQLLHH